MQLDSKQQSYWPSLGYLLIVALLLVVGIWLFGGELMDIP